MGQTAAPTAVISAFLLPLLPEGVPMTPMLQVPMYPWPQAPVSSYPPCSGFLHPHIPVSPLPCVYRSSTSTVCMSPVSPSPLCHPYPVSPGPCDPPTLCPQVPASPVPWFPAAPGPPCPCSLLALFSHVLQCHASPRPCPLRLRVPASSLPCVPEPPYSHTHIPLLVAPSPPLNSTHPTKAEVLWHRGGWQSWLGVPGWSHRAHLPPSSAPMP